MHVVCLLGEVSRNASPTEPTKPERRRHLPPLATRTKLREYAVTKEYDLSIDPKRKLVIVNGQVCLREGQLEMFACPKGSKEHESIVSVNCKPQFVHAALVAIGADNRASRSVLTPRIGRPAGRS